MNPLDRMSIPDAAVSRRSRGLAVQCLAVSLMMTVGAQAQLLVSDTTQTYTVTFDSTISGVNNGAFTGAGFAPSPSAGQLDSDAFSITGMSDGDLAFGGTETSGDYARGEDPDAVSTGGVYSFDVGSGNRTLGFQPGGDDFTPGTLLFRVQNTSGKEIESLTFSYDIYTYNDENRANSFNFSHSSESTGPFTSVSSLDYTSPEAASDFPVWELTSRSATLTGLSIQNSDFYYFRWDSNDVSGSGSRDQLAVDNLKISGISAIPEPSSALAAMLMFSMTVIGTRRRTR